MKKLKLVLEGAVITLEYFIYIYPLQETTLMVKAVHFFLGSFQQPGQRHGDDTVPLEMRAWSQHCAIHARPWPCNTYILSLEYPPCDLFNVCFMAAPQQCPQDDE